MRYPLLFLSLFLFTLLSAQPGEEGITDFWKTNDVAFKWRHQGNLMSGDSSGHRGQFTIIRRNDKPWGKDWAIYFNAAPMHFESENELFSITRVSGDLFVMRPTEKFFADVAPPRRKDGLIYSSEWVKGIPNRRQRSFTIDYLASQPLVNYSTAPNGYIYVPKVKKEPTTFTRLPHIMHPESGASILRGAEDRRSTVTTEERFAANEGLATADLGAGIVPRPVTHRSLGEDSVRFDPATVVVVQSGTGPAARLLQGYLKSGSAPPAGLTDQAPAANYINLAVDPALDVPAEGYRLVVKNEDRSVWITGRDEAGLFYGVQTLRSLLPPAGVEGAFLLPHLEVEDYPRFGYRGMHLDVARNFHDKASVLQLLDAMAFYKLNTFHFHLTDDEGWRLAIPGLPELTDYGSVRGYSTDEAEFLHPSYYSGAQTDDPYGSGHYSTDDFKDILRYAHERHITVIPEIDLPGHARAAVKSMEYRYRRLRSDRKPEAEAAAYLLSDPDDRSEYVSVQGYDDNVIDVCRESTYRFIAKVVDEIREMYRQADVPLHTFHIGGDEVPAGVWADLPSCSEDLTGGTTDAGAIKDRLSAHFLDRFHRILQERNLRTAGWEEIALHRVADSTTGKKSWEVDSDRVGDNLLAYVWNNLGGQRDLAYRLANGGHDVVLCNVTHLYFDLAYEPGFYQSGLTWGGYVDTKRTFSFAPYRVSLTQTTDPLGRPFPADPSEATLTEAGRRHVKGIQGQLWSETVRGRKMQHYMIFPKLLALAERAWSPESNWEKSGDLTELQNAWQGFARRVGSRELPRLSAWGIDYRVPNVANKMEGRTLHLNHAYFTGNLRIDWMYGFQEVLGTANYSGPLEVYPGATSARVMVDLPGGVKYLGGVDLLNR